MKENNNWIPVSERLPEEPYGCIVTEEYEHPFTDETITRIVPVTAGYHKGSWNDCDGNELNNNIVAWQPLPEPWRGEGK